MARIICIVLAVIIGAAVVFGVVFTGYRTAHYMISAGWSFSEALQTGWSELLGIVGIKVAKAENNAIVIEFPMANAHIDF